MIPKKKIQSVIPTKTSQRLQNINKAFENGQNLEENIRISFTKNGLNFENTLKEQALKRAQKRVNYVSHQMALEDQEVSQEEKEAQIRKLAEELLKAPQKLWEE